MLAKYVSLEKNDLYMLALYMDLQKNMLPIRAKHILPKNYTLCMSEKCVFHIVISFYQIKSTQKSRTNRFCLILYY